MLGGYSPNNHPDESGRPISSNGTEYTDACKKQACQLIESADVNIAHPKKISATGLRDVSQDPDPKEAFGKLRDVRIDQSGDVRADLYYLRDDEFTRGVIHDVESGLGVYGLSINARSGNERLNKNTGRLMIESLEMVRSVDLVLKPATNRNLWESSNVAEPKKRYTIREIIETRSAKLCLSSANRASWIRDLLEDDSMKSAMGRDAGEVEEGGAEEELWSGFHSGIMALLEDYKSGQCDPNECVKKIGKFIKGHAKLTQAEEPMDVSEEEEDPPAGEGDKKKEGEGENGKVDGKQLEESGSDEIRGKNKKGQIRAMWHNDPTNPYESLQVKVIELENREKCRELCEGLQFQPTKDQLAALMEIKSERLRKTTAEAFAKGSAGKRTIFLPPRSKDLTESRSTDAGKPLDAKDQLNLLRR